MEGECWAWRLWAEIADPVFLTKVHRYEQLFGEGDVLKAEYLSTSVRQTGKIESDTKLVRIIEVIPPETPAAQVSFLPPAPTAPLIEKSGSPV